MWTYPKGHKQLLPRDQDQGIMLLLFCCREFGYGFHQSPECLDDVNNIRTGRDYSRVEVAEKINGSKKSLLHHLL